MKRLLFGLFLCLCRLVSSAARPAKLKVAYPTTVGSRAALWMTQEAKPFEKHGLEVELI